MADKVTLKVRRLFPETEAREITETVDNIVRAVDDGMFDAHLDTIFAAFDRRIQAYQEEKGDGELPTTRDQSDKLRPMRTEIAPVIPVEGKHYRLRGAKYFGVVVMYVEMAGHNEKQQPLVLVETITANDNAMVKPAQRYKVPLIALVEIPEEKKPEKTGNGKVPYGHTKCRNCGESVEYSGRGRPKALCSVCEFHKK